MSNRDEFIRKIENARGRILLMVRAKRALRLLAAGACAALAIALLSRAFPVPSVNTILVIVAAAAVLSASVYAALGRVSLTQGALVLDRRIGLSERLSTAAEMLENSRNNENGVAPLMFEDAFKTAKKIEIPSVVPFHTPKECTVFIVLVLATAVALAVPPAYAGADGGERIYRVSISVENNLSAMSASINAKTGSAADLKKGIESAGDDLKRDPKAGLKAMIVLSKRVGEMMEKEKSAATALSEMKKTGALSDLAKAVENRADISDAVKKAAESADGAGGENRGMKAALEAVRAALASDAELRKMVENLLDELEKRNAAAFERQLALIAEELSGRGAAALRELKDRLDADAEALANALGVGTGTLEPGSGQTRGAAAERGSESFKPPEPPMQNADIELKIENARIPERYRTVVMRYFETSQ
jgi:hypothetical protein